MSTNRDQDFMSIALDLARLGLGRTSPNPAVGCVIVKDGKILATGFHKKAGLPHAEAEAIASLKTQSSKLKGARLYVNLEPCCHFGRTPPCTDAIIQSGIREVVIGMKDPDPKVSGRGIRKLKQAGIKVTVGVLEEEYRELNRAYITHREKNRPFVYLKMAMNLQGVIGWKGRGELNPRLHVTGAKAQRYAHRYRDEVDAILVGVGTVLADNPQLNTRISGGKDPLRIILDPGHKTPSTAKVMTLKSSARTMIVSEPTDAQGRIKLKPLLRKLADQGIVSLLVEGGPRVWESFLRERLVDQILLFIGTNRWRQISKKTVRAPLEQLVPRLKEISLTEIGEDLLIEGAVSGS